MSDPTSTSFQTLAALAVAMSDLIVVKDIRQAIRANLVAAGGVEGALGTFTMPQHRSQVEYTQKWRELPSESTPAVDRYEPSRAVETVLRDAARSGVYTSTSSTRPAFDNDAGRLANQGTRAIDPAARVEAEPPLGPRQTPLVPPWRLPLPIESIEGARVIKFEAPKPDLMHKGQLIDTFL